MFTLAPPVPEFDLFKEPPVKQAALADFLLTFVLAILLQIELHKEPIEAFIGFRSNGDRLEMNILF